MEQHGFYHSGISASTARGGLWAVSAEASQRLAQTAVFFVLAGIIPASEFGLVSIAFLTIQVVNSLTYGGWSAAVQALGADLKRDRTAVSLCLALGIAGATTMVLAAFPLCSVLNARGAENYIRLIAISLPLTQFNDLSSAFLERNFRFKTTAVAQIVSSVISGVLAFSALLSGVGAVSLVLQTLAQQIVRCVILILAQPTVILIGFSRQAARELWSIGRHLTKATIASNLSANADNAVVSALRGPYAVGGYGFTYSLCNLPYYLIAVTTSRVLLPVYSRVKSNGGDVGTTFQTAFRFVAVVCALPLGYLLLAGPRLVDIIFDNKWHDFGQTLSILAVTVWVRALIASAYPVLLTTGRAKHQGHVQVLQLVVMLPLVFVFTDLAGPSGAALGVLTASVIAFIYVVRILRLAVSLDYQQLVRTLLLASVCGLGGGYAGQLTLLFLFQDRSMSAISLISSTLAWLLLWLLISRSSLLALVHSLLPLRLRR